MMKKASIRRNKIVALVEAKKFASVKELSQRFGVSEMTIRRDLNKLETQDRIVRTFGGGAPIPMDSSDRPSGSGPFQDSEGTFSLFQEVDVIITTLFNPRYNPIFYGNDGKTRFPIVSESVPHKDSLTCIGVDNYHGGFALGKWAANYAQEHFLGKAHVLDLTYHLPNTEARSRGFLDGLTEFLPEVASVISLNPESRYDLAYQLTQDALKANQDINIIFAINDTNAWGAIQACIDLKIDPEKMTVISFGLEGDTIKNAILNDLYCKVSLAMFPEIVGKTCVDAAVLAYRSTALPKRLITPHAIITKDRLIDFYAQQETGWELRWETVWKELELPEICQQTLSESALNHPNTIGMLIPFPEHEWYQNLVESIISYAEDANMDIRVFDAEQNLKDELEFRKREIARRAAQEIQAGETIFIDGGNVTRYLAEFCSDKTGTMVITNATTILDILEHNPEITLISTGGVLRRNSSSLVGPTAENLLRDIRVDKLFLTVSGVSIDFGLSHSSVSEVSIKKAMIKSARQVILLADHTKFNQESFTQIAPLNVVDILITDNGLPASSRLQLNGAGIEVIIAQT
jgi:DeoR/GlpR family transcriptional regulator of sugar metabolism